MALLSSDAAYGIATPSDYHLGRGILYLDAYDTTLNLATGLYRDVGNTTTFALNITEEELEHQSSRAGLKITDAAVSISKELGGSFTLDSLNEENWAAFLSGIIDESVAQVVQGAAVQVFPRGKVFSGGSLINASGQQMAGTWVEVWTTQTTGGLRVYNIAGVSAFKTGATPIAAVLGTDYEIDLKMGLLLIKQGGLLDVAGLITFECTRPAITFKDVEIFKKTNLRAALRFTSINAQTGEIREVKLHKCKITAEGDGNLISDDWGTLQFNFIAEADPVNYPDAPTGYIRAFNPTVATA